MRVHFLREVPIRPVALLALLSGCVYPNAYGGGRVLAPGETGYLVLLDAVTRARSPEDPTPVHPPGPVPVPRFAMRMGLPGGIEPGLTLGLGGAGADVRVGLHDRPGLALATGVGASVAWFTRPDSWYLETRVPLQAQIRLGRRVDLTPHLLAGHGLDLPSGRGSGLVGAGLGAIVRVSGGLAIQPAAAAMVETDSLFAYYGVGLGFLIGEGMHR